MYELRQYRGKKCWLHGVNDNVSGLIAFYYEHRQQHGKMVIVDTSDNDRVLATLTA